MKTLLGGAHGASLKRGFRRLWQAWAEAQAQVPLLRWLGLAAVTLTLLVAVLAATQGGTALEAALDGLIAVLFALAVSAILFLLFEIQRQHRRDAIFGDRRLGTLIRRLSREEIGANEAARLSMEDRLTLSELSRSARAKAYRDGIG